MKIEHDGQVHNPLGGGAYMFKDDFVRYLATVLKKDETTMSIGAQPNSSPHFGTSIVFNLAFALAGEIRKVTANESKVMFEVVDTAPAQTVKRDGIDYQISLRDSGSIDRHMPHYDNLLSILSDISGVPFSK